MESKSKSQRNTTQKQYLYNILLTLILSFCLQKKNFNYENINFNLKLNYKQFKLMHVIRAVSSIKNTTTNNNFKNKTILKK